MKSLPAITDRPEGFALVIRTDYTDERAWQVVRAEASEGDDDWDPYVHFVEDPAWTEASVDEVVAALSTDEYLSVVFLADRTTMQADHHALLAVTTVTREELDDDEAYEQEIEFGRSFRTVPVGVHPIHGNLNIANMDFPEFAAYAQRDPEGVFRGFQ